MNVKTDKRFRASQSITNDSKREVEVGEIVFFFFRDNGCNQCNELSLKKERNNFNIVYNLPRSSIFWNFYIIYNIFLALSEGLYWRRIVNILFYLIPVSKGFLRSSGKPYWNTVRQSKTSLYKEQNTVYMHKDLQKRCL